MELSRVERMQWAQVNIYAEMDNWRFEKECAEYFKVKRVTEYLYRRYLQHRFPDLFDEADGRF